MSKTSKQAKEGFSFEKEREEISRSFASRLFEFIKFSHTLFALPFAFAAVALAVIVNNDAGGVRLQMGFWVNRLALIVAAMVLARTAAMTFNRLADWNIDRKNSRTAGRHKLLS